MNKHWVLLLKNIKDRATGAALKQPMASVPTEDPRGVYAIFCGSMECSKCLLQVTQKEFKSGQWRLSQPTHNRVLTHRAPLPVKTLVRCIWQSKHKNPCIGWLNFIELDFWKNKALEVGKLISGKENSVIKGTYLSPLLLGPLSDLSRILRSCLISSHHGHHLHLLRAISASGLT